MVYLLVTRAYHPIHCPDVRVDVPLEPCEFFLGGSLETVWKIVEFDTEPITRWVVVYGHFFFGVSDMFFRVRTFDWM